MSQPRKNRAKKKPRTPAATRAKKTAAKRTAGEATRRLTVRQDKLRRILIATRGLLDVGETAKLLGVAPSVLWEDRRVIQALAPIDTRVSGWDEAQESAAIQDAILFYEGAIEVLLAELGRVQAFEDAKQKERDEVIENGALSLSKSFSIHNTTNLKLGIFNTISVFRRDLNQFMIQIGLIREAPKRFIFEGSGGIGDTASDIAEGITDIRKQLADLRKRRAQVEGKRGDD